MFPKFKRSIHLAVLFVMLFSQLSSNFTWAHGSDLSGINTITGRVTDGNGHGVSGVTVTAAPGFRLLFLPLIGGKPSGSGTSSIFPAPQADSASTVYTAVTDENGDYTIASLPGGTYRLQAAKDTIQFSPSSRTVSLPDTSSQDFQVQILPAVVAPDTEVIDPATNQSLESVSADGTVFTYSETTPELQALVPGDFMVGDVTAAAPNGYLRKVTGVTDQGGSVVVETEPAVLEEAVQDGSVYLNEALNPAAVTAMTALPGVTQRRAGVDNPLTFYFEVKDVVLYDDDGNLSTKDDQVKANGSLEFEMDFEMYLNIQGFELRNLTFANRNTLRDKIEVVSEAKLASIKQEKILASQTFTPITVMMGPVPVVFVPKLDVVVGVDGSVKVGISTSLSHDLTMRAGVEYVNPAGWRPISELTSKFTYEPPHATLEASIKGYFGARFNLYLYGVAGPYVKVTPYLEFKIKPLETPWWVLYAGVDVPAGFRVSEEVKEAAKWVGLKLEEYEVAAIGKKVVVTQAQTANHAPNVPSRPTPTNGATSVSTYVTLSWTGGDPDGDAVTYDVYFEAGDSTPDVLVSNDQTTTKFTPGQLVPGVTYYWQINATDAYGWSQAGPVWSFTTLANYP